MELKALKFSSTLKLYVTPISWLSSIEVYGEQENLSF